jgi:hypothetical protein
VTTRHAATFRTAHNGAGTGHRAARLPRRVNPRLTARVLGIRCTPRVQEWVHMIAGIVTMISFLCDFDNDPTFWRPLAVQAFDAVGTWWMHR